MKNILLFYLSVLILFDTACTNPDAIKSSQRIDAHLQSLLEQKEYFRLRTQLKLNKDRINAEQRLYFQAYLDYAFNRNEQALKKADSLLKNDYSGISDSLKGALYLLESNSYFNLFRYAKAAYADSIILKDYTKVLDSGKISDIRNSYLLHKALRNIPPQQTLAEQPTVVRWKKDELGIMEIPLKCNWKIYNGILDTRANISSISQTYAAKLGLKRLNVSYKEGSGVTGLTFRTSVGVADSLYIGHILFRNVVFQIMPDSILYIPPLSFSLNIIIGFPVIGQLKEIHIYRDGRIIIPSHQSKSRLHNLALDAHDPVIALSIGGDTLSFYFDSGAGSTTLYYAFFEKYKSQILKDGHVKTIQFAGAGGVQQRKVYILPRVGFYLDDKKITIDSVSVNTKKIIASEKFYGNIGWDFIDQFSEMIWNFDRMFVEGK